MMSCEHTTPFEAPSWSEPVAEDRGGCYDCLAAGDTVWAHLRMCMTCGHVACCDSSPHRHATQHHKATGHPVMRSFEPGERWRWCFVDHRIV
ncbi:UBP-type zinc finger domain-containing protein [Actinomycetes bacterium KLBMP 9759]